MPSRTSDIAFALDRLAYVDKFSDRVDMTRVGVFGHSFGGVIQDGLHQPFLFGDDGALLKSHIVMGTLRALGLVGIDGRRQLAVTAYSVHTFFDAYLKETAARPPVLTSPLYPEIGSLDRQPLPHGRGSVKTP